MNISLRYVSLLFAGAVIAGLSTASFSSSETATAKGSGNEKASIAEPNDADEEIRRLKQEIANSIIEPILVHLDEMDPEASINKLKFILAQVREHDGRVTNIEPAQLKSVRPANRTPTIVSSTGGNGKQALEYQLAVINAGTYVSQDHLSVARFRSLLEQLDRTFLDSKQRIADVTVAGQMQLKKNGIDESLLNVMEGMNQLFLTETNMTKYSEYVGTYVVLRIKGQSHIQALGGLRSLLRTIGLN